MVTLQRNGDRGWRVKDTKTGGQFYFSQEDTYHVLNMLSLLNENPTNAHSMEYKSETGRNISWFKSKKGGYRLQTWREVFDNCFGDIYVPQEDASRMLTRWQQRIGMWSTAGNYTFRDDKGEKV